MQAQDASASQAYWREQLGQLAAPTRLVDALPKSEAGQGHGVQSRGFDAQATQGLVAFAKRERITLNTLVQGAWALLLQRYSGQEAVAFGATVAGRPSELAGAEQMLGLFINTLPVICAPKASQPVGEWLRALQAQNLAAREHEHTPLYEIQRWAGLGGQGLFDSILVFENYPVDQVLREALPGGLHATVVDKRDETSYPVTLSVVQDDALDLQLSHDRALIDDEVATRIASHLVNLLQALVGDSHAAVASLAVLDDHERSQLQSWGLNPERHAGLDPVHLTIARQASLRPQATALVFEDQVLSHFELNRRANRLAHRLIAQGVRPESRVGIAVARSVEMIVGLLAILKAGATYVPLDPEYPSDRLAYMVDDSGLQLVLTQTSLLASLPPSEVPVLAIDAPADVSPHHDHDPIVPVHGHQLAYIIYTSGSTGQPKGVGISHQALAEHAQVSIGFFGLTPEDRMLQFATLNFDGFIEQVYPTLCAGAAIVLRGPQLWDSETFYQALIDKRISVADLTTAYWFLLAQDFARQAPRDYGALRQVHAGGEAMPPEGLKAWRDAGLGHIKLLNTYGPTEATVTATVLDCGPYVRGSLPAPAQMPIGSPLAGRQLHVLDANLQSVPVGVAGELCIGGELLARGYLNRPGLSAERFVANPFTETGEEGGRLYRTGDLVRWSAQGQLEYLGRIDHQVKIRGFRIELGEIEAQLLAEPQVREAVVVAQTAASGARLLAYVSPQEGHSLDNATLRQSLAQALPEYMVPGVIVVLERLPLNPNGKVDRKALPEPDRAGHEDHYEAPQGEVEQALAAIWAEVLGIVRVGRQDNFFELGGHSLAVLQVQAKAQEALSTRLPLKTYFEQPSLQGISAALHSQRVQAQATETADIDEMAALLESLES
ncbi:Linear gramicidin synthase subunit D [Aquabacterium sp. CECT 9606]|nr:Linear gramicidin synthase subunit D [Aquabacterium sp. CECT 9606]